MSEISSQKADTYFQALLDRDPKFIGIFFVGVKTTSVFCIATCRARKPKRENVVFYKSFEEALQHGYRPCKICKPTENAFETPQEVQRAIQLITDHPKEKISDERLREEGIGPDQVRRWFKSNYGLTFHAYQRMYRINHAYKELKDGKKATATAFDHGYESLSGFGYTYKKLLGRSPSRSSEKQIILIQRLTTPLGPMFVCATDHGVCLLEYTDRKMLETEFRDLQKLLQAEIFIGRNTHIDQAEQELAEYFQGTRKQFEVPFDTPGTPFQQNVWNKLGSIGFGQTSTYQGLAQQVGRPNAVRAVARANGANRISIMVPCHRIIGKNGDLTGYGGGIERKKWLIDFEAQHI